MRPINDNIGWNSWTDSQIDPKTNKLSSDTTADIVKQIDDINKHSQQTIEQIKSGLDNANLSDVNGIVNSKGLYVNGSPYIGSQWLTSNVGIGTTSNVGIGTLNPSSYTLQVIGTGNFTGSVTAPNLITSLSPTIRHS